MNINYEFSNSIIKVCQCYISWFLLTILWLGKTMSLVLGSITEEFRDKEGIMSPNHL